MTGAGDWDLDVHTQSRQATRAPAHAGGLSNNAKWIYSIEMFNHCLCKTNTANQVHFKVLYFWFILFFFYDFLILVYFALVVISFLFWAYPPTMLFHHLKGPYSTSCFLSSYNHFVLELTKPFRCLLLREICFSTFLQSYRSGYLFQCHSSRLYS